MWINIKKWLRWCLLALVIFELIFVFLQWSTYQTYTRNYNQALGQIIQYVKENPDEVSADDIIEILNRNEAGSEDIEHILAEYGIDFEKDSLILLNEQLWRQSTVINFAFLIFFAIVLIFIFLFYNLKKNKEIEQIVRYIDQINHRNYKLEIDTVTEDELSILKSEIYKTTVMLKEVAENATNGKKSLKNTLSDISHQIKTPLASMKIMLDNMETYPDMKIDTRQYYIKKMQREIQNINFLIQSLLKLSKLEADVVDFAKERVETKLLVAAAINNVDILCDLKNIHMDVSGNSGNIECDYHWQIEAVTNVLKNCVEYSPENENVLIEMQDNSIYASIIIRDFGPGMDLEEQKHIFERFYKGKNATPGSIGIGLALAKAIIEANNGKISVVSDSNGTKFEIRYFK